ncbi:unnamed protein product, partial [Brenthis ino]
MHMRPRRKVDSLRAAFCQAAECEPQLLATRSECIARARGRLARDCDRIYTIPLPVDIVLITFIVPACDRALIHHSQYTFVA